MSLTVPTESLRAIFNACLRMEGAIDQDDLPGRRVVDNNKGFHAIFQDQNLRSSSMVTLPQPTDDVAPAPRRMMPDLMMTLAPLMAISPAMIALYMTGAIPYVVLDLLVKLAFRMPSLLKQSVRVGMKMYELNEREIRRILSNCQNLVSATSKLTADEWDRMQDAVLEKIIATGYLATEAIRKLQDMPDTLATKWKAKHWSSPWERLAQGYIRILSYSHVGDDGILACKMEAVSLEDDASASKPNYQAVSYAWGKLIPGMKLLPLYVNGFKVWIWPNLHAALSQMWSQSKVVKLWLDALSIDQLDIQERNEQVALMSQIFSKAQKVIVWLGEIDTLEASLVQKAWDVIIRARHHPEELAKVAEAVFVAEDVFESGYDWRTRLTEFIELVSKRPWFHRVWTVQEILKAENAIVFIGHLSMRWDDFYQGFHQISFELGLHQRFEKSWDLIRPVKSGVRQESLNLTQLLIATRHRGATDPRDRVFAVLGLLYPRQGPTSARSSRDIATLQADYSLEIGDVFIRAARHCITMDASLKILELVNPLDSIAGKDNEDSDDDDDAYDEDDEDALGDWIWAYDSEDLDDENPRSLMQLLSAMTLKSLPSWVPNLQSAHAMRGLLTDFNSSLMYQDRPKISPGSPEWSQRHWSLNPMIIPGTGDRDIVLGGLAIGKISFTAPWEPMEVTSIAQCSSHLYSMSVELQRLRGPDRIEPQNTASILATFYMHHVAKRCGCLSSGFQPKVNKKHFPSGIKDGDWLCVLFGCEKLCVLRPRMVESLQWAKDLIMAGKDRRLGDFRLIGMIHSEISGKIGSSQWKDWQTLDCLPLYFSLV